VETGYFAINPAADEEQILIDRWEEYPQLKIVVDQLKATKPPASTQGVLISVTPNLDS